MSSQRVGKYACLEIERRYLLGSPPIGLSETAESWYIVDHYFLDTRLRLRRMSSVSGSEIIYKLGQKYRSATQDASKTTITNMYLTEEEYSFLEKLEGKVTEKKRFRHEVEGRIYSIDVFEGRHRGLVLAEIEFEMESELANISLPDFAIKDVTDDPFFTGGFLAGLLKHEFRERLARYLNNPS